MTARTPFTELNMPLPVPTGYEARGYLQGDLAARLYVRLPDTDATAGVRRVQAAAAAKDWLAGGTVVNVIDRTDGWYDVRVVDVPDDGYAKDEEPFG